MKTVASEVWSALEARGLEVPAETRRRLVKALERRMGPSPRIGVFGKTGVGKSSLCNSLFGAELCAVSAIETATQAPQEVPLRFTATRDEVVLLDVPGVGESEAMDERHEAIYRETLHSLDAVLWVLKADDRAMRTDLAVFDRLVRPWVEDGLPFLVLINQADQIEPSESWNARANAPGAAQSRNLALRRERVAQGFGVSDASVLVMSAERGYNLVAVLEALFAILPDAHKIRLMRQLHRSRPELGAGVRQDGLQALWKEIDQVVDEVPVPVAWKSAYKSARTVADGAFDLFRMFF